MYQSQKETLSEGSSYKYILYDEDKRLTFGGFLERLQTNETFRSFFIELLYGISFRAYHWETPPVSPSSLRQEFEFVVSRSPGIDLPPDPGPFKQYFNSDNEIAIFDNLGKDAKLIAPTPTDHDLNYSHIGVFTRQAPVKQQHALWQSVGRVMQEEISDQPLWLNTAGGGVAWLHVRLDSKPKYYRHRPYAVID